jgi:hypothetical protein
LLSYNLADFAMVILLFSQNFGNDIGHIAFHLVRHVGVSDDQTIEFVEVGFEFLHQYLNQ